MPFTTLNIPRVYLLSSARVQDLQDVVRREGEIRVSIGGGRYSVSYLQMMDGFSVEPVRGGLLDRLLRREHRMEEIAITLERRLNNGTSPVQNYFLRQVAASKDGTTRCAILQDKINSCSFHPDSNHFSCPESFLTCPITLDIPETGVFMRNSLDSDICSLYDKDALLQLIKAGGEHPLSRELIKKPMIIRQDECHFDSKREVFVVSDI